MKLGFFCEYLVRIDEDDLTQVHREEDIQEENLVAPDNTLLLLLVVQPARPLIRNQLDARVVSLAEERRELLNV